MENNKLQEAAMNYANENSCDLLYTGKDMWKALNDAYIAGAKFIEENQ